MRINTKTRNAAIIGILVAQIALLSCSSLSATDTEPNLGIEDKYMNKQVTVHAPESFNSFRTNDPIVLEILNHSENGVRFSNDYSLRIFKKTDDRWVEIKEIPTTRLPKDDIVFSPNVSDIEDLAVFPDLKDYSREYQLRIYVVGDMRTQQGYQKVSAYAEVQLQP